MAAPTVYKSTDGSAPTLNGTVGAVITVLDAILVNGYGAKAAAGWTKSYSGTNKAVYRQGTGSNQLYLRVDDNGPGAGGAKECRARGYTTMTDVDTGTQPFPNDATSTTGRYWRKSTTADATARTWCCIADAKRFYFFVQPGDTSGSNTGWFFGDIISRSAITDAYATMLVGKSTENTGTDTAGTLWNGNYYVQNTTGLHAMARDFTLVGSGMLHHFYSAAYGADDSTANLLSGASTMSGSYPNMVDGTMHAAKVHCVQGSTARAVRGHMPGLLHIGVAASTLLENYTQYSGSGVFAGKTYLAINGPGSSTVGTILVENTDWEA